MRPRRRTGRARRPRSPSPVPISASACALRHGAPQRLAGERAPQILGERRAVRAPHRPRPSRADGRASSRRHRRQTPRIARRAQVSSVSTNPLASSASPVSASQGAAAASVTHSASSKPIAAPSAAISRPGSTRTTGLAATTRMPRSARIWVEFRSHPRIVRRHQRIAGDQCDLGRVAEQPGQSMMSG